MTDLVNPIFDEIKEWFLLGLHGGKKRRLLVKEKGNESRSVQ